MSATMRDVARLAGVSVKTVSNVVNDFPHVSASTRERVRAAIDELGYQMNFSARNLSLGRTGMITLAVPELRLPYFAELSDEIIDAAAARGYTVLIEQTGSERDRELEVLTSARRRMTDGLILSSLALRPADAPALDVDFPLVLVGERWLHASTPRVAMSNVGGARALTEHLLATGRRRIAILGSYRDGGVSAGTLRTRGVLEALAAAGIEHDPSLTGEAAPWTRASGASAMRTVLDRGVAFDAVVGLNDVLALGAMRVLFERGLRIPQDVAVVGFDNIEEGRYSRPSLTTVEPGKAEIARAAVDLLLGRVEAGARGRGRGADEPGEGAPEADPQGATRTAGSDQDPPDVVVDFTLLVRESTSGQADAGPPDD